MTLVIQSSIIDFLESHQGNTVKQTIYVMYPGLATLSTNYIIRVSVPTVKRADVNLTLTAYFYSLVAVPFAVSF